MNQVQWWMIPAWIVMSLLVQYLMARRGRAPGAHIRTGLLQGACLAYLVYMWLNPTPA